MVTDQMLKDLLTQRFPIVLLGFGFALLSVSIFKVEDLAKLSMTPRQDFSILGTLLGVVAMAAAVALFLITEGILPQSLGMSSVRTTENGFYVERGRCTISVLFGRLEHVECTEPTCLVALPANEYLDDECINDTRSALGAFVGHHFRGSIDRIEALVEKELAGIASEDVEKAPGVFAPSYGIGHCVFLDRPLSSSLRIAMVAVTTKRVGEGLKARASYIFRAVRSVALKMVDQRLDTLVIPVIGSGHGGLREELSLLCMLIGFYEFLGSDPGHHIRRIQIIVFQRDPKAPVSISKRMVRRALSFVSRHA